MNPKKKSTPLSVIIPVYNEEEAICKVLDGILAHDADYEIIVVDDGSTDRTAELAENKGVTVIRHAFRRGNGASVKTGLANANSENVCVIDGDGQHPPAEIPHLLEELRDADMVVGSRKSNYEGNRVRNIGNWVLRKLAGYISGRKIPDLTSGFRIFRKKTIMEYVGLFPDGFSFPTTSTLAYLQDGYIVKFIPVDVLPRRNAESKINLLDDGFLFLSIILRIAILFKPMKVFGPVVLTFWLVGLIDAVYTIVFYRDMPGTAMILFISGVVILFCSLLAEQIAYIRRELSRLQKKID